MSTLLLRLAGPLQAWGDSSRFNVRGTRREPTKSGIVGMLAAAEGRRRIDPVEDLAALRFGVRVDQRGTTMRDFQTEIDWRNGKSKPLTQRYYLSDALFLVGLEGPTAVLQGLSEALRNPAFPVFLGRRSCPPTGRLVIGIREAELETALRAEPWLASEWYRRRQSDPVSLPLSLDAGVRDRTDELVRDIPVSFDPRDRRHDLRAVSHGWVEVPNDSGRAAVAHDPLGLL